MTLLCQACGCSETRACVTEQGPCHWASRQPPICSACAPIVAIIAQLLNRNLSDICADRDFREDLGADDLDRLEATMLLETEFDVDITDVDYTGWRTIGDLVAIFAKLRSQARAA